jgi:hypothetical protein
MKTEFKAGVTVIHTASGEQVNISNHCKSYDWRVPGYLGEGFYQVVLLSGIHAGKERIVHEDELTLAPLEVIHEISSNPHGELGRSSAYSDAPMEGLV